jgi:hypothetical protein
MPIKSAIGGWIYASGLTTKFIIWALRETFVAGRAALIPERGTDRHPRRGRGGGANSVWQNSEY